jgi:hypothetical protein
MSGPYWYNGEYHAEKCSEISLAQQNLEALVVSLRAEIKFLHEELAHTREKMETAK